MQSFRTLTLAIAATLALAPVASLARMPSGCRAGHPQDNSSESASAKRVSIVGLRLAEPTKDPSGSKVDGDGAPTLGVTYHINDNIGIEAWGADKFGHRVSASGQKIASVGAHRSRSAVSTISATPTRPCGRSSVWVTTKPITAKRPPKRSAAGRPACRPGDRQRRHGHRRCRSQHRPTWFARADARYLDGDSELKLDGVNAGDAKLNPVIIGVGIGARF